MRLLLAALVALTFSVDAATYYVSAAGSDAADGTTTGTAWQTLAKVNGETFAPGDSILLRRGDSWRETLIPPSSGTAGARITFGAYGTGTNPLLIGSDPFDATGATLTAGQAATYELASATTPGWVWEDTVPLALKTSIATVEATAGTWWWDSGAQKLYVHAYDGSNVATNGKLYERSGRDHNIEITAKDYITVDGIDCVRTGGSDATLGGLVTTGDYTIVRNGTFQEHRRHGVTFYTGSENGRAEGLTVRDSYVTSALAVYGDGTIGTTVTRCRISGERFRSTSNGGIVVHGKASGTVIEANLFLNAQWGVLVYDAGTTGTMIRKNRFTGGQNASIYVRTNAADTTVSQNVFGPDAGVAVGLAATGTRIYANTFAGTTAPVFAIVVSGASANTEIKGNIVSCAKGIGVSADSSATTTANHNLYQLTGVGTMFQWNGSNYSTFAAWKTASSQDAGSLTGDPRLLAPASGDYRLQGASPARNAGTDLGFTADIVGNPIVGTPDIGAYEYDSRPRLVLP